jgi:hypothetical protein
MERLGHVVVGAKAKSADLALDATEPGEDQNRSFRLGDAQRAQHLKARYIRQVQVEQDDVVIVDFAELDAFFAQIGGVDVEVLGLEHPLNELGGGAVVLLPASLAGRAGARPDHSISGTRGLMTAHILRT